jgi:K+-sensing histidine kinase KdpD
LFSQNGQGSSNSEGSDIIRRKSVGQLKDEENLIGLGLFISMQIVKAYKGQIDFLSFTEGPQKGSTFVFSFELEINFEK